MTSIKTLYQRSISICFYKPQTFCSLKPEVSQTLKQTVHCPKCAGYGLKLSHSEGKMTLLSHSFFGTTPCNVTQRVWWECSGHTEQVTDQRAKRKVFTTGEARKRKKEKVEGRSRENHDCAWKKENSLFFWPLYCWAFFFCLGTDWGISLLP